MGDIVRLSGESKYAKVVESNKCNGCVFLDKWCNVICGDREQDDVYYKPLAEVSE